MTVSDAMSRNLEKIRVRVNNWVQGKGYGPEGFPKNAAKHDVIFLLRYVADLEEEQKEECDCLNGATRTLEEQ